MVLKHDHYDGITVDLLIAQRLHLFNLFFFIATLTAWVCQRWLCSWWLPLELWITSCPPSATTMHARGRRSAQLERHTVLKMYTCRIFGVVATERTKNCSLFLNAWFGSTRTSVKGSCMPIHCISLYIYSHAVCCRHITT